MAVEDSIAAVTKMRRPLMKSMSRAWVGRTGKLTLRAAISAVRPLVWRSYRPHNLPPPPLVPRLLDTTAAQNIQ